jgi:hypothetical protein
MAEEIADRQGYATAMLDGHTLPELEKAKHPAADEIAALWLAVKMRLEKVKAQELRAAS